MVGGDASVGEVALWQPAEPASQPLQSGPQQAPIGTGGRRLHVDPDRRARRADHLDVVGRPEAAIGHRHHPRVWIRGGGPRLLLLLVLAGSRPAPLTLRLDLVQLAQRGLDPGLTLPRRPLPRLRRPLAAGRRIGIHLALQLRHQILRRSQMLLQPRAPSERSRAGARPDPDPVLRQRPQVDHAGRYQGRHVLRQKPVQKGPVTHPEVRQRVRVHRHPAAQPSVRIVLLAQSCQRTRTSDTVLGRVKPQCKLKPRRDRGMARMPLARLHRSLQIAQIKALAIAPDHPCRMLRAKHAGQVDSSQLDLIALRLPKPRPASRRPSLRLASFREFLEQTVVRHRHLRDHSESESRYAEPSKRSKGTRPKDSHALSWTLTDRTPARLELVWRERGGPPVLRSEEHTSELQSLMRISYAVFCLQKTINHIPT